MTTLKCMYCDFKTNDITSLCQHIEKEHIDLVPPDMTISQYIYYVKTGKKHGSCIICKRPTLWNDKTDKYKRFCENPTCKEKYVKMFQNRMIGKYGKTTLLKDPEFQRKMLAGRSISNIYKWSDGTEKLYTGQYELSFLKFLDLVLEYDSSDVIAPSPHNYYYMYEGTQHFYFPDMYICSLNVEIEIKDGGDNKNTHPKILAVDKVKERLKDDVFKSNKNTFNYLKIIDKHNEKFFKFLEIAKYQYINDIKTPIIMID